MDRNYQADAVNSVPDLSTLVSQGYPTNGSSALGIAATQPGAAWFYMITEELRNAITSAGLTPDHTDITQLFQALRSWQCFPTGFTLEWTSKNAIPENWLIMNGQSVSKSTYADLNDFINSDGSLDDSGDSSKFIIPDMTGRVWQGCSSYSDVLVAKEAGLPNITGSISNRSFANTTTNGLIWPTDAFSEQDVSTAQFSAYTESGNTSTTARKMTFTASNSNAIYGANTTVQNPARQALMIIKV